MLLDRVKDEQLLLRQKKDTPARIGMVNFINTAPFYEVWKDTVLRPEWTIIEGPPSQLNRLLFADELDFGLISSHEYALHAPAYHILDGLSISALGPVGSVFLFSEKKIKDLSGRLVLLSPQSQTSNSLVKIILEDFLGIFPRYSLAPQGNEEIGARLAIGDEALRLAGQGQYPVQLDLGRIWNDHTGRPFVFAVWAVRKEFYGRYPKTVANVQGELLRCVQEGKKRLSIISRSVASRIPLDPQACEEYLRGMEYDLSPEKKDALTHFFHYLIKRGEVPQTALPLSIIG